MHVQIAHYTDDLTCLFVDFLTLIAPGQYITAASSQATRVAVVLTLHIPGPAAR